jgi:hypothetical protein
LTLQAAALGLLITSAYAAALQCLSAANQQSLLLELVTILGAFKYDREAALIEPLSR